MESCSSVRLITQKHGIQPLDTLRTNYGNTMAPSEITVDYYAVLEIPQSATLKTVRESYRRLARVRHPDKNLYNRAATSAFQTVSLTYL